MRTLFVPLAIMALAAPPAFSQPAAGSNPSPIRHTAAATAEPAGPLDLRSALALALRFNPGLSSASRERETSDAAVLQAGAWPNPVFDAQVEDLRRGNRTTTLQLSQPIELGGKRAARVTAAERARDQAASALLARRSELRASVITMFFEVLAAQERLRLAQHRRRGESAHHIRSSISRQPVERAVRLREARVRVAPERGQLLARRT